jgi:hypothetical protein
MDINPPANNVFNLGIGSKILWGFIALAGFIGPILIIVLVLAFANSATSNLGILIPILAFEVLALYFVVKIMTTVLIIEREQLVFKNLFTTQTVLFSNIGGYRAVRARSRLLIVLLPVDPSQKELKLSLFVDRQSELVTWLAAHFADANRVEFAEEENSLLQNSAYGENPQQRQGNLALSRKVALWINILGCSFLAAMAIPWNPPTALIMAAIVFVPLSFIAVPWSKRVIYVNYKNNSPHPFIAVGITAASASLLVGAVKGPTLLEFSPIWIPAGILAFVVWCLLLVATPEFAKRTAMDIANAIAFLIVMCVYAVGTYVTTNSSLDSGPTQSYVATVIDKQISVGKNVTNYHIFIKSGSPLGDKRLTVEKDFYDATRVNDSVYVHAKEGRWGCAWYYLDRKSTGP